MSWYQQLEQKRTLLVGGVIAICIATLAVTARRNILSFDGFWHLQAGLDWLNQGLSPWFDHFSYTFRGEAIVGPPYLFQAMIAWLVNELGLELGFALFKFCAFLLILGLVLFLLKKLRASVFIYLLVLPLVVLLIQFRAITRPELISYSLSVIAVMLYNRANGRISIRNMLPIAALMLFWSNYHSPIIGYVVFFGFFVDAALLQLREKADGRAWALWLAWGLIVVGLGFLNPGLTHPLLRMLDFAPEWVILIQEYRSAALYLHTAGAYVLLALLVVTIASTLWKRQIGYLVISLILAFVALRVSRMVAPCGIVVLCLFAITASSWNLEGQLNRMSAKMNGVIGTVIALMVAVSIGSSVSLARAHMEENRTSAAMMPEAMVDYMVEQNMAGRIFNEYGIGGYLIYRLAPDTEVYIDGRTDILYPVEHYKRLLEAEGNSAVLRAEIEKYDINLVLLESDQAAYSVVYGTGRFGLDFVDGQYSLFTRVNPNFPVLGKLLAQPACWEEEIIPALTEEQATAIWHLPGNSTLHPYAQLVVGYSQAEDKAEFLTMLEGQVADVDTHLRFLAYQALSLGLNQTAFDLFLRLQELELNDFLASAIANIRLDRWSVAEDMIDRAIHVDWPQVTSDDMVLIFQILENINHNAGIQSVSTAYLDGLREQVEAMGLPAMNTEFVSSRFCRPPDGDPVQVVHEPS